MLYNRAQAFSRHSLLHCIFIYKKKKTVCLCFGFSFFPFRTWMDPSGRGLMERGLLISIVSTFSLCFLGSNIPIWQSTPELTDHEVGGSHTSFRSSSNVSHTPFGFDIDTTIVSSTRSLYSSTTRAILDETLWLVALFSLYFHI